MTVRRRGDGELMVRTPTHPPTDRGMWRRLLARAHLDAGGTHERFIWTGAVRDAVCNERLSSRDDKSTMPRFNEDPSRVPFDRVADLEVLTDRALTMAAAVAEPYGYLLRQVTDC